MRTGHVHVILYYFLLFLLYIYTASLHKALFLMKYVLLPEIYRSLNVNVK